MKTMTIEMARDVYPSREKWSHKGDHGRLLVIGGSRRFKGAPALCGMAALRTGIDLAVVAAPESASDVIASFSPDLITEPLEGDYLNLSGVRKLAALASRHDAVVIGNGLGRMAGTRDALLELLPMIGSPCLIDADALHLLHDDLDVIKPGWVLTPHASEFYSMTHARPGNSIESRAKQASSFSSKHGAVVLLKGYKDVAADGKKVVMNSTGNPFMTVGGTGDVLAGICGALLAMGIKPLQAAATSAYICGEAGNMAGERLGPGMLASDVLDSIPAVIKRIIE